MLDSACAQRVVLEVRYQRQTQDSYRGRLLLLATDQPNPHQEAGGSSGGGTYSHTYQKMHVPIHSKDKHLLPRRASGIG